MSINFKKYEEALKKSLNNKQFNLPFYQNAINEYKSNLHSMKQEDDLWLDYYASQFGKHELESEFINPDLECLTKYEEEL